VLSDTVNYLRGKHSLKFGGEWRRFYNNNFTLDTGPSPLRISTTSLPAMQRRSVSRLATVPRNCQGALGVYVQDNYKWRPNLTLELGLRYDWKCLPLKGLTAS